MAKTAKLTLLIDLADKISGKLGKLEGKLNKFQGKMQNKLNKFSDKIGDKLGMSGESIKRGLKVGAMAGVAALSTLAYKGADAAEKFDSAFLPIRNLNLDKSKGELDSYRSKIRDATYEVGTNLQDSTNAMYDLQSATGLYGKDAIDVFKKVGRYSIATGANINDAMNSTTKAMKAFGLGVADIDKLLTSNAKTVQVGITTFDELAKVQTEYAGAAASAGQGVDQANKVFAMFTSVAKNSDVGATMAKTFFQGLGQQADKFEETLGIQVFDKNGSMRNADAILKDISGKFKNMTDKEITQAINKIGGPEGLRGALDKVKTGADDMISTFNAFDSSKFSLEDALKNAEGDFATMKAMFSNRLEAVFSKFGEKILPMLAKLFDVLNPVLDWLYNNMDSVAIGLGVMSTALGVATVAVWALNSAFLANPIVWIILGIGALVTIIVLAVKHYEKWGATLLWFLGPIGRVISAFKLIYDHWDSIKKAFESDGIVGALKRIGVVLFDVILQPLEQILNMLSKMPGKFGEMAASAKNEVHRFRENMDLVETPNQKRLREHSEMEKEHGSEADYFLAQQNKKEKSETNLYEDKKGGLGGLFKNSSKPKNSVGSSVKKITGASTSAKNINIKIDALHKGNNNLRGEGGRKLSMKEYEAMFEEMMMRIIRNAELS